MSGQRMPFLRKLGSEWLGYRNQTKSLGRLARTVLNIHGDLLNCMKVHVGLPVEQARILEVGCGQKALQLAMFTTEHASIVGVDVEVPTYDMSFGVFVQSMRRNGLERALKSLARHVLLDRKLLGELSRQYGRSVLIKGLDARVMDAKHLEFEDSSFDFVYSIAVMEHVDDVRAVVTGINRVLKATGAAFINVHLYPSIGGSHCPEWNDPEGSPSDNVPPWDHLRGNRYPANTYLNKLKLDDYREIVGSSMTVIEENKWEMGERFLTPEIESELAAKGFSREDLVTGTVTFIAKKKA